jgi:hypothetical protein
MERNKNRRCTPYGCPNQLIQLFINDLQINSECFRNAKYMENKRRELHLLMESAFFNLENFL